MPAVLVIIVLLSSVMVIEYAVVLDGAVVSAVVAMISSLAFLAEAAWRLAALASNDD